MSRMSIRPTFGTRNGGRGGASMEFEFKCVLCGEMHSGIPTYGADAPLSYYEIPGQERDQRCSFGSGLRDRRVALELFL
jgi:hypothetical protein